jgi:hypothetical protein
MMHPDFKKPANQTTIFTPMERRFVPTDENSKEKDLNV